MKHSSIGRHLAALFAAAGAVLLGSCTSVPLPQQPPMTPSPSQPPAAGVPQATEPGVRTVRASSASNPRAYRADAATHLYGLNQARIWKGRLPPMLYAIGVLNVEVDSRGDVRNLHWLRAPRHAPEVMSEIERTVRSAAPFPVPLRLGKVVYTDTWLWHESGRFQLDTLTEGQD